MLHGGSVMFKPNDKQVWFDSTESPIDWTVEGLYVIDAMYLPYRIALAEGKTVQYKMGIIANSNEPKWFDLTPKEFNSYKVKDFWDKDFWDNIKGVENYRIKPEEPKFKVGDYVRYIHTNSPKPLQIVNINCERYYFENAKIILRLDEIEKWEPREGEVCIFWSDGAYSAVIGIFSNMNQEKYVTITTETWSNCMPFTGTLPPHIKD